MIMTKNKKIFLATAVQLLILFMLVIPIFTHATTTESSSNSSGIVTIKNPFKADSITGLIEVIINSILKPIGAVVAVVMIIYAGFLFATSRGEPGKITKAREAIQAAVIGAAILLGAWVISEAIQGTVESLKS